MRRIEEKRIQQKKKKTKRKQKKIVIREEEIQEEEADRKGAEKTEQKDITEEREKREQIDETVVCTISYLCWGETFSGGPSEGSQGSQKRNKIKIGIFTAMFCFPNHTLKLKAPDQSQSAGDVYHVQSLLTHDITQLLVQRFV